MIALPPLKLCRYVAQFETSQQAHAVERYMIEDGATFSEATRLYQFEQGVHFILFMEEIEAESD